jgi:hypothetical protein
MESNGKNPRAQSPLDVLAHFLRGRPLTNREGHSREIGIAEGVPALGLDGLSSSAYGPEAALSILVAAGAAGLAALGPIMLVILALLAILFVSYGQTIKAYPISGGAYTVAKENLGVNASLLASAGIMVDYVLNVAVGISAGVVARQSGSVYACSAGTAETRATRVRQRLYGDDRRRGDQQRRRRIPRALRDKRPSDARRDCRNIGHPARRHRLPRDVLRHYGHGPDAA